MTDWPYPFVLTCLCQDSEEDEEEKKRRRRRKKGLANASVVQKPQSKKKKKIQLPYLQVGASATMRCLCQQGNSRAALGTHMRRPGANTTKGAR